MGEGDPFVDIDSDADLQGLIADIIPETERCNAHEYVNRDDDLSRLVMQKIKKWVQLGQPTEATVKRCKRVKHSKKDLLQHL